MRKPLKIWSQLPVFMPRQIFGSYYDLLMEAYGRFKEPETEIVIHDVSTGIQDPELINTFGFRELNDSEIVRTMVAAEREGYDAIAGACYFDSGIRVTRNLLSIPVVGPAEASMHLAAMIGHKLAVITSEPGFVEEMTHYLVSNGFGAFALDHRPVRGMTMPVTKINENLLSGNSGAVIDNFLEVARGCLADGADVIIAGCGVMSPIFTMEGLRDVEGAPVLDPMIVSLKTAELLARLQQAGMQVKTARGLYSVPSSEVLERGFKDLRL